MVSRIRYCAVDHEVAEACGPRDCRPCDSSPYGLSLLWCRELALAFAPRMERRLTPSHHARCNVMELLAIAV